MAESDPETLEEITPLHAPVLDDETQTQRRKTPTGPPLTDNESVLSCSSPQSRPYPSSYRCLAATEEPYTMIKRKAAAMDPAPSKVEGEEYRRYLSETGEPYKLAAAEAAPSKAEDYRRCLLAKEDPYKSEAAPSKADDYRRCLSATTEPYNIIHNRATTCTPLPENIEPMQNYSTSNSRSRTSDDEGSHFHPNVSGMTYSHTTSFPLSNHPQHFQFKLPSSPYGYGQCGSSASNIYTGMLVQHPQDKDDDQFFSLSSDSEDADDVRRHPQQIHSKSSRINAQSSNSTNINFKPCASGSTIHQPSNTCVTSFHLPDMYAAANSPVKTGASSGTYHQYASNIPLLATGSTIRSITSRSRSTDKKQHSSSASEWNETRKNTLVHLLQEFVHLIEVDGHHKSRLAPSPEPCSTMLPTTKISNISHLAGNRSQGTLFASSKHSSNRGTDVSGHSTAYHASDCVQSPTPCNVLISPNVQKAPFALIPVDGQPDLFQLIPMSQCGIGKTIPKWQPGSETVHYNMSDTSRQQNGIYSRDIVQECALMNGPCALEGNQPPTEISREPTDEASIQAKACASPTLPDTSCICTVCQCAMTDDETDAGTCTNDDTSAQENIQRAVAVSTSVGRSLLQGDMSGNDTTAQENIQRAVAVSTSVGRSLLQGDMSGNDTTAQENIQRAVAVSTSVGRSLLQGDASFPRVYGLMSDDTGTTGGDEDSDVECGETEEEECRDAQVKRRAARRQRRAIKSSSNYECNCCHCNAVRDKKCCVDLAEDLEKIDNTCGGGGSGGGSELKFFIDSLILDLEAMEHARRKKQYEQNICMPAACPRQSFPVTITEVSELGASSLYVKWHIHDCYGIAGYEIFVDGYLTNRYFHSNHEAAVVCDIDVTRQHKVVLVAIPRVEDDSNNSMCSDQSNICTTLLRKLDVSKFDNDCISSCPKAPSDLWVSSIYLYDPCCRPEAPPIPRISC